MNDRFGKPNPGIDEEDDGAPTAEMPQRHEPRDPAEDTAEAPAMRRRGAHPVRRGLSKGDKVKLWIILGSPVLFLLLIGGLFLIKDEEGNSMWKRFMENAFGQSVPEEDRTGRAKLVHFQNELEKGRANIKFYAEGLDKLEAEYRAMADPQREQLLDLAARAENYVKALQNVSNDVAVLKKGVEEFERAGKEVNPSSSDVQQVLSELDPILERGRKLQIDFSNKAWESKIPPPPSGDTPIIESGGHPKKQDEKKEHDPK